MIDPAVWDAITKGDPLAPYPANGTTVRWRKDGQHGTGKVILCWLAMDSVAVNIETGDGTIQTVIPEFHGRLEPVEDEAAQPAGCQMPCDPDCEISPAHCWNWHRPNHKPDWHDPRGCDGRRELAAENAERRAIARRRPPHWAGED